ncbi:MAG: NGG1p interacting factor NIF3 [Elusimicrobiota bacterium]
MKIGDLMEFAVKQGIKADPRSEDEIKKILEHKKEKYDKLEGIEKEIFDLHSLESPYADSRIIWGSADTEVDEVWAGIDVDTSELLLIKRQAEKNKTSPVVVSHHPLGRSLANFYEVMDMQADILQGMGIPISIADNITRKRKNEVSRKVAPVNHFKTQDAARILDIPTMNIHTPADNHVKRYLDDLFDEEKPIKLNQIIDLLLNIEEYRKSAENGVGPRILNGSKENRCGKIFVDMTGGTEGDPELVNKLVDNGISTIVGMHFSEKHYKNAKKANINIIIAGHISSDSLGLNLLFGKAVKKLGEIKIINFGGYIRVKRDG